MMDPAAQAIPDFVLTMAQAIHYAECGITWGQSDNMHHLPPSICNLFRTLMNPYSFILQQFLNILERWRRLVSTQNANASSIFTSAMAPSIALVTASNRPPATNNSSPLNERAAHVYAPFLERFLSQPAPTPLRACLEVSIPTAVQTISSLLI